MNQTSAAMLGYQPCITSWQVHSSNAILTATPNDMKFGALREFIEYVYNVGTFTSPKLKTQRANKCSEII